MRFVFFIVAAVVAIVVGVVVLRFNEPPAPAPQIVQAQAVKEVNIKTVDVLVAKADIPVGTVVDNSMVDTQPWPENLVLSNFVSASEEGGVVGKVVRAPIQAREPFIRSKLANPNDPGFLSAGLPAGMRAVTVAIDSISGVAGYVFPGDRVDVMFTHASFTDKQASKGQLSVAEVIAPNVRVLAVGEREIVSAAPPSGGEGGRPPANPQQPPSASKNVTLEVSDALAQHIRLAEKNGSLSLSLRSIRDDNAASPSPTTIGDLSRVAGGAGLLIVRGPRGANGKITADDGLSDAPAAAFPNVQ